MTDSLCIFIKLHNWLTPFVRSHRTLHGHLTGPMYMQLDTCTLFLLHTLGFMNVSHLDLLTKAMWML